MPTAAPPPSDRSRWPHVVESVVWAALFALSYTQAPPYYSNQNQYLLHGLAAAGDGNLGDDWLANTVSPTPVFDALVGLTARHLGEGLFPVYYALLQGVYFVSLLGIMRHIAGDRLTPRTRRLATAFVLLAHAAVLRSLSFRALGWDYPCYLQGWLAAQYVLGPVFQPSAFGVLLVVALNQFAAGRPIVAVVCCAGAVMFHATYAPHAALIVHGLITSLIAVGQGRTAVGAGAMFAFLIAPTAAFVAWTFGGASPEMRPAQELLAHVRIPHHAVPAVWFDSIAAAQVAWIVLGVALTRGTRLYAPLLALLIGSLAMTALQLATANDGLALLFPWRSSVVLIPVATAVIVTRLVVLAGRHLDRPATTWAAGALVTACAAAGVALMVTGKGYAVNTVEGPLLDYVRTHKRPGDVCLLPVQVPKPPARWSGSLSSDFKPAAAPRLDGRVIPADFQRFRLVTRAAVYIDFKAIPYKDIEVLEWDRRLRWCQAVYARPDWDRDGTLGEVVAEGVTHVVAARDHDITSSGLTLEYADDHFLLYRVRR